MSHKAISKDYPLILASASPRREALLRQIGIPFRQLVSDVEENEVKGSPARKARILSEKKALGVLKRVSNRWILGADTIVLIGNKILGKPSSRDEARSMLHLLSGERHRVITGFCILDPSGSLSHSESVATLVRVKPLSGQEIDAYIATGEPFGKAGGYAIQGVGSFIVESISGSYTNVVGLPVCALIKALQGIGAIMNFPFPS